MKILRYVLAIGVVIFLLRNELFDIFGFEKEELKVMRCKVVGQYMADTTSGELIIKASDLRISQLSKTIMEKMDRPERFGMYIGGVRLAAESEARPDGSNLDGDILKKWAKSEYCIELIDSYKSSRPIAAIVPKKIIKAQASNAGAESQSAKPQATANQKLSIAAEKAIQEGFVEIKDPVIQACTDTRIEVIKKEIGEDAPIGYEIYNEAAVNCGFNI